MWTSHKQLTAFLYMMFLRVRSVTQTNILVGIRSLRLLWHEKLFCRSGCLSLLWKPMCTTVTLGKFTNNTTLTMRNRCSWVIYIIISLVKGSSETQGRSVEGGKTASKAFKNKREDPRAATLDEPVSRLIRTTVCDLRLRIFSALQEASIYRAAFAIFLYEEV